MKIVFVGGVHGAGKSYLCSALAPKIGATYRVASDLLGSRSSTSKTVSNIRGNQDTILEAVEALRNRTARLLLDGHFCLGTTNGVQGIPIEYFASLAPSALLLVEAPESEIHRRLEERDRAVQSQAALTLLIECERAHADLVSRSLSVPLKILSGTGALSDAVSFISPFLR